MFRTRISDVAARLREANVRSGAAAPHSVRDRAAGQEGFTLAGLIIIMTLISIFVAYTVPDQWSLVMNRERDRQTIWVMKQYARAIMTFHQKHKVLPTSLKQLHDARQPRVVRGEAEFVCPLTGEADWILVPPQAVTVAGAPGAVPGFDPNVPTTTIQEGRGAIVVPITDPRVTGKPGPTPGMPGAPGGAPGAPGTTPVQFSKLNPELSPADYKDGPIVGVRPRKKGKSMLALNEAEDYGQWVYTYQDTYNEVAARAQSLYKQ